MDGIENLASEHASESVSILCDEMSVKDGLVCDINTGRLAGYTDINIDKDLHHMQVNKNKMATYVRAATYATTTATTEAVLGAGRHCGAVRVERSCICW